MARSGVGVQGVSFPDDAGVGQELEGVVGGVFEDDGHIGGVLEAMGDGEDVAVFSEDGAAAGDAGEIGGGCVPDFIGGFEVFGGEEDGGGLEDLIVELLELGGVEVELGEGGSAFDGGGVVMAGGGREDAGGYGQAGEPSKRETHGHVSLSRAAKIGERTMGFKK